MTTPDGNRRSDRSGGSAAALDPRVQDYVDGALDAKEALRLHLRAQADAGLAAELAATRSFFTALDRLPRVEPAAGFDARVLASIPLDHYRSAPRRGPAVLVIGDLAPAMWWVALRRAGRGAMATAAAYLLVLVVANSAMQSGISQLALSVDRALAAAAERTASSDALSPLVSGLARGYDAVVGVAAAVADTVGPQMAVFGLGAVIAAIALAGLSARQRRHLDAKRAR